jgi:hypothetical protein
VQRKQQVGECWVCVIFFARVVVSKRLCRACRGLEGGCRGSGAAPPNFFSHWDDIFSGPHDI